MKQTSRRKKIIPSTNKPGDKIEVVGDPSQYYFSQLQQDLHEIEFQQYEHEKWDDEAQAWSPLITLEQLEARPDLAIEWYCPSWIPVGAKTIISAEPKCGKTILLFHILQAVVTGGSFCGEVCTPAKVLYFTEQTEHEFKRQIKEVPNLLGNPNFFVLLAEDTPPEIKTWDQMLVFIERMLAITKAKIVVLDTFIGLAKLPPEGENDSAPIQNNINKLNALFKNRYLSVVFTHHNKKKNDDPKRQHDKPTLQWARGSSAFVGGAGHIVVMDTPADGGRTRDFYFFGRYNHGTEMHLNLLPEGRYIHA